SAPVATETAGGGAASAAPATPSAPAAPPTPGTPAPTATQAPAAAQAPSAPAPSAPAPSAPAPSAPAPSGPAPSAPVPPHENGGRPRSSPLARRLASARGLDLGRVQGSGPGGRIIKRDIEAASTAGPAATPSAAPRPAAAGDYTDVPLTQIRKTIARRLTESIGPIPTFYLTMEADL